jgi:CubicO group peptidase (beta-lactamase class C family)
VTSILVGAAIRDGYIESLEDPLTRYLPELSGSAYDGVTISQLLTMQSGVRWNEDYTDPDSDVARMESITVQPGQEIAVEYMKALPRESSPGEKWVYKTGETSLVGALVRRATHRSLAQYLSEKVWVPYGMQQDAYWISDPSGHEIGGCCLLMSLRDYGRFGEFVLEGGNPAVGAQWVEAATASHVQFPGGAGYGYQWWTYPEGVFAARGIFGQSITIDPARHLVIVILGSWPKASNEELWAQRARFVDAIRRAADGANR